MRVAVDARSLQAPGPGRGIAVYLELPALAELAASCTPADRFEPVTDGQRAQRSPRRPPSGARASTGSPAAATSPGSPAPAPLAVSAGVPFVLTVHDLSFEHRPATSRLRARLAPVARPRASQRGPRG